MKIPWKLSYYGVVVLTMPCLLAAVPVGIAELVLGGAGEAAFLVARPFLWAVERDYER